MNVSIIYESLLHHMLSVYHSHSLILLFSVNVRRETRYPPEEDIKRIRDFGCKQPVSISETSLETDQRLTVNMLVCVH